MDPSRFPLVVIRDTVMTVTNCFRQSIISHTSQHYGVSIASSWSPYKLVCALYWNQDYYGLIYVIDIYTHYLFIYCCGICNPEQYWVVVGYSPTSGERVSAKSCRYYAIQLLPWLNFPINQLYCILANITGIELHILIALEIC